MHTGALPDIFRSTLRGVAPVISAFLVVLLAAACGSPSVGQSRTGLADDGARIVAVDSIDARTRDLTVDSPAVGMVKVRLLIPADYDSSTGKLPVLVLLHGGGGEYVDWSEDTGVEEYTATAELLVAMPAAASSYVVEETPQPDGSIAFPGRPQWETFHLTELPQLLQRNWRASPVEAVGGLSLGGYSAMMYTARHPGIFAATASFSGVLDATTGANGSAAVTELIGQVEQTADDSNWPDVNPIDLVPALNGATLFISYGNGQAGPLDEPSAQPDDLEAWVGAGDDNFVLALRKARLSATVDAYGPGTHSWVYWDRELKRALPLIVQSLGSNSVAPSYATTP